MTQVNKMALTNGNIITMDEMNPSAQAILVIGDTIFKVGLNNEINSHIDNQTHVIDLKGRTMIPGFIDCHAHPMDFGQLILSVDCRTPPVASIKQMIKIISDVADSKPAGDWVIGMGYNDFNLFEKRHPNRWDLDEASPNNPVIIERFCGHIITVNSLVLDLAGITADSKGPDGGKIDRDPETNIPTGVLRGRARDPVRVHIPPPDIEHLRKAINQASSQILARGITSISDAGVDSAVNMIAYQKAIREDGMPLRVNLMMSTSVLKELKTLGIVTGFGDDRLRIGAIKIVIDGSTSGRTAAIFEPYEDVPESTGILYHSLEKLKDKVFAAHQAGFQVGVHAIGDRAVKVTLDAYEAALEKLPRSNHRHRIEHCGIINPAILSKLKALEIIPVPQPIFLYGEGETYRAGLGENRVKWVYAMKSFIEYGIITPMSSDCPATAGSELISPLLGIYVAVTRKTDANRELGANQKISVEEALRAYTLNSAYATFEEDVKGSIEPGKLADFAILSNNPLSARESEIKDIQVEMTIVGGKIVYTKP